ncbi:unnamed protein product [Knipowitschia caucasica]|uniref:Transposase element L1Md-A101/L1Md-A102/L1Md-A2 n=1 Tax=Knipowitschia caucasica TaxID=637954 RepID=A0AAV2M595_KNICA
MPGKGKKQKTAHVGPDQTPSSRDMDAHEESTDDEEDTSNRAVLAAITALKGEMAKMKDDICANVDRRIERVYNDLRQEITMANNSVQASIASIEANSQKLHDKAADMERAATAHSDSISQLEQQVASLNSDVATLKRKNEELEGNSRRNNIRITGICEGLGMTKPRDFIATLLKDALALNEQPMIDRAHRTLRQRPSPSEPPRPFVIRIHHYHVLEEILRKAATIKNLQYQGKTIRIFPDYPPTVVKRRALFNRARQVLRNQPDVRYGLLYPARLLVTHNGSQLSFTDPQKAEEYAERLTGSARPQIVEAM